MYKVVVTDLDGTLLNNEATVSEFSKQTIRKLRDSGVRFFIATGRAFPDTQQIMNSIGIKVSLITSNGAVINDREGKEIFRQDLGHDIAQKVLDIDVTTVSPNIQTNIYSDNEWFVDDRYIDPSYLTEDPDNPFLKSYKYKYDAIPLNEIKEKIITKIFFISTHEVLLKLEKKLMAIIGDDANMAFTSPYCLEVFHSSVNKANAIKKLGELEGFSLEDVVSFGDGFNDFEMLSQTGKGFVMSNADYKLKDALPKNEVIGANRANAVANKIIEIFEDQMLDSRDVLFYNGKYKIVKINLQAGEKIERHNHPDKDVIFTVLKGKINLLLNDRTKKTLDTGKIINFSGNRYLEGIAVEDTQISVTLLNK